MPSDARVGFSYKTFLVVASALTIGAAGYFLGLKSQTTAPTSQALQPPSPQQEAQITASLNPASSSTVSEDVGADATVSQADKNDAGTDAKLQIVNALGGSQ